MQHSGFGRLRDMYGGFLSWKGLVRACAVIVILAAPRPGVPACSETPTVMMDERTAETHLLSKKDPQLPASVPTLARVRKVVLLVTVDREGVICDVRPLRGPKELSKAAMRAVKRHWRYRRFLVDWKPVVAQFPVSVHFVLPQPEPVRITNHRIATSLARA